MSHKKHEFIKDQELYYWDHSDNISNFRLSKYIYCGPNPQARDYNVFVINANGDVENLSIDRLHTNTETLQKVHELEEKLIKKLVEVQNMKKEL